MNESPDRMPRREMLAWGLYTVLALGLFLFFTFPFEPLQSRLLNEVSFRTGIEVRAEGWQPAWPLGLVWTGVSATGPGLPRFGAERLELETELLALLQGRVSLTGRLRLPNPQGSGGGSMAGGANSGTAGTIAARLSLDSWAGEGPGHFAGSIEQANLSALSVPMTKQGILRVTFDQRWKGLAGPLGFLHGQGTWQAELTGLELEQVPIGVAILPSLSFATLKARLQCQEGTCKIEGLQGDGPDGTLTGEGVLTLKHPLSESMLILSLSLTATDGLKRRVPAAAILPGPQSPPLKVTLAGPLSNLQPKL